MSADAALAGASPTPFWLAPRPGVAPPAERPPVAGDDVDLVIVGAGLTGLWAGYEAAAAGRQVVVVDGGRIGGGASGRCGGFINASITHGIPNGVARWPDEMERILSIQRRIWSDTLALVDGDTADEPIIATAGKLSVATRPHQLADVHAGAELLARAGEDVDELDAAGLRELIDSPTYQGGYWLRSGNGICDPARLVWRIAELAEAAGATIAEQSAVRRLHRHGAGVRVDFAHTSVRARQVLLCTNAYPPLLRRIAARVIPVYDHVVVTAPLGQERWDEIGWAAPVGVTDIGNQFHYYRPTPDGRLLFGGWEASYHFPGRFDERHECDPAVHALLVDHMVATFPQLAGVPITNAWGGAIDSTSRFTPTMHTAWGGRIGWAVGFTGLGVGASRFGALAALDLLAAQTTERTELSMVRRQPLPFPPEPLRWPIVAFTKRALQRQDRDGHRGLWLRFLDRLGVGFDT